MEVVAILGTYVTALFPFIGHHLKTTPNSEKDDLRLDFQRNLC